MKKISLILILLCFASCDCYQNVSGTVTDDKGAPIPSVVLYNKRKSYNKTKTDSLGQFQLTAVSGGFRCPPMHIVLENKGYKAVQTSIPSGGQKTIKMQKLHFQATSLNDIQGSWYHELDSLASVQIVKDRWTFKYKGEKPSAGSTYTITLTDKLSKDEFSENLEYLLLTNNSDTLKYEIVGVTDTTFGIMYLPAGKVHLYKRLVNSKSRQ
jgi:hypothetical protein